MLRARELPKNYNEDLKAIFEGLTLPIEGVEVPIFVQKHKAILDKFKLCCDVLDINDFYEFMSLARDSKDFSSVIDALGKANVSADSKDALLAAYDKLPTKGAEHDAANDKAFLRALTVVLQGEMEIVKLNYFSGINADMKGEVASALLQLKTEVRKVYCHDEEKVAKPKSAIDQFKDDIASMPEDFDKCSDDLGKLIKAFPLLCPDEQKEYEMWSKRWDKTYQGKVDKSKFISLLAFNISRLQYKKQDYQAHHRVLTKLASTFFHKSSLDFNDFHNEVLKKWPNLADDVASAYNSENYSLPDGEDLLTAERILQPVASPRVASGPSTPRASSGPATPRASSRSRSPRTSFSSSN